MTNLLRRFIVALGLAAASVSSAQAQSSASAHGFFLAVMKAHPVLVTDFLWRAPQVREVVAVQSSGCESRITSHVLGEQPRESVLDWRNVNSVRLEGERDLRLLGRGVDTRFGFPTRDLAIRSGNALSLLRRECDPLAGFGF